MLLLVVAISTMLATTVVSAVSLPPCRLSDTLTVQRSYTDWNSSVLDLTYRLPTTYAPRDLRSTAAAGLNGGNLVRSFVIADLRAMVAAARSAGARLAVQSAYRSFATQRSTFAYWSRVSGYTAALKASARAGHSEHQLGTAIDFRSYGGSAPWYSADWGNSRAGAWLRKNAWKFGFLMTYPQGKTSVTCYTYEPWHYRYVGRQLAASIRASGSTIREYLWRRQTTPTPTPTSTPTTSPSTEPTPEPTPSVEPTPTVDPSPSETPIADPTPADPTPTG